MRRDSILRNIGIAVVVIAVGVVVAVFIVKPNSSGPGPHAAAANGASLSCPAGSAGSTVSSWVGNSYGGADDEWVQPGMQGLWVSAGGVAYGESIFNEGARELRGYRNGKPFGGYTYQHATDLPNGGVAVAGDSSYVYATVRFGNSAGVMRFHSNLSPAPWSGGADPQNATLVVNPTYEYLSALAVANGHLYVADPNHYDSQTSDTPSDATTIRVYNTANLAAGQQSTFPAPRARGLAVDGDGDIWVLEQGDGTHQPQIVRFTPSGHPTGQVITTVTDPTAIAVDTSAGGVGRLLVADDGPDQDIKIFTGLSGKPVMSATFGVKGGVNAGPVRGVIGPDRLNGPNAVAVDAAGNIYVVSDGTPSFAVQGYGQGADLESFRPNGQLRWQAYGQKYNTTATGLDASTGVDLYSAFDHFRLDLSRPTGEQWTRVGWTLDRFRYPYDPRINGQGDGQLPTNPLVRTLDGHTFLFMGNGMADALNIFRFEPPSQTAIPSGSIDTYQAKASPTPGEFIWRDTNGDGSPYGNVGNEYVHPTVEANADVTGWWVDTAGNVWQTTTSHGIREFLFGGLDSVGNPIYSYHHMRTFATPAPFTDPRRLVFDPSSDTLVLSGYTAASPAPVTNSHDYKFAGTTLAVYHDFTKQPTQAAAWVREIPYTQSDSDAAHKTITLTTAGDYIFVGYFTGADNQLNSDIHVFAISDGAPAGVITPGPEIGGRSGNTDMEDGTAAYQTPGGGYLIFDEDDLYAKTIMYEWCPPK